MYKDSIPCDKTGAKPGEVCGGILAGIMGLRKILQVICLIFSSLDAAGPFVVPAEGERPSKKRRVKTSLVVTPPSLGGANQAQNKAHIRFSAPSFYVYHGPKRELSIESLAQCDVILTTTRSPEEAFLTTRLVAVLVLRMVVVHFRSSISLR